MKIKTLVRCNASVKCINYGLKKPGVESRERTIWPLKLLPTLKLGYEVIKACVMLYGHTCCGDMEWGEWPWRAVLPEGPRSSSQRRTVASDDCLAMNY